MAQAKKPLTEKQKAEQRRKNTESKRKSRAIQAQEEKKQEKIRESKRKSFRKAQIEKRNAIWEAYMRDCYGK